MTDVRRPFPGTRRIAVCGKGGSGKTAFTALLAQALRGDGADVLAVDLDTNPGLALSLGLDPDVIRIPDEAVEEDADATYGWTLHHALDPVTAVARYAASGPDGIRVIGFGDATDARHGLGRRITAVRTVFDGFDEGGWWVLGDLEAGPATPFEGFARTVDLAVVLVEATQASCWAAQRLLSILDHDGVDAAIVVSQARASGDVDVVRQSLGDIDLLGAIPFDGGLVAAERSGAVVGLQDSPAVAAVQEIARRIASRTGREVVGS